MEKQLSIRITNDLAEIERVATQFESFRQFHNLSDKVSNAVQVALDELITNIISYAYEDEEPHEIQIRIALHKRALALTIKDDGKPYNPLHSEAPDTQSPLIDRPIGGLGLHLVKKLMDSFEYSYKQNHNCLHLTKNLQHPLSMEITQNQEGQIQVLTISGRLDTLSSTALKNKLEGLIEQEQHQILIDCSQLDFISSSGLRVLLSASKQISSRKGKLVLCALKDHVKEVFDIAGFLVIFSIFPGKAAALESF